jgi:SAM-dependent methyltransferase
MRRATRGLGLSRAVELSTILILLDCRPGDRLLDVGGPLRFSTRIMRTFGYEVVALDVSRVRPGTRRGRIPGDLAGLHKTRSSSRRAGELPFADESFDGILGVHAMGLAWGRPKVLMELHRVLKPGARAVFWGCGPVSPFPATGPAENDRRLGIHEFRRTALEAGFERASLPPMESPLDLHRLGDVEQRRIDASGPAQAFIAETGDLIHSQTLAVLVRGGIRPRTSRRPGMLRGQLTVCQIARTVVPGQTITLRAIAENTGDTVWLREPSRFGGFVTIGCRLFTATGRLVKAGFGRTELSIEVAPGDRVQARWRVRMPRNLTPGLYVVTVDLVNELAYSFSDLEPQSASTHTIEVVAAKV